MTANATPRALTNAQGWPTVEQEQLLKAALFSGDAAQDAWRAWRESMDLDRIDIACWGILGMLSVNLEKEGVTDPWARRYENARRTIQARTDRLFRRFPDILAAFNQAGIETLVLKGAALVPIYYRRRDVRYLSDIDLLIHPHQVRPAVELLQRLGWSASLPGSFLTDDYFRVRHSHNFSGPDDVGVDLHWRALLEDADPGADALFWEKAATFTTETFSAKTLCPTDFLFHICAHGLRWNPIPSFRWIADALLIMRSSPSIDWDRMALMAVRRRSAVVIQEGMGYLKTVFNAPVPTEFLSALERQAGSPAERREFHARLRPPGLFNRLPALFYRYQAFFPLAQSKGFLGRLWWFPHYIRYAMEWDDWESVRSFFRRREGKKIPNWPEPLSPEQNSPTR